MAGGVAARPRLRGRGAAGRGRPHQPLGRPRAAGRGAVDPSRLRTAVLSEPRGERAAARAGGLRREGHRGGADRGARPAAGGRRDPGGAAARGGGGARQPRRASRQPHPARLALPPERRAHRQPARHRDPRRLSGAAVRDGEDRPFVASGGGGVGDREAGRRPGGPADAAAAVQPEARRHELHGDPARRRGRPERGAPRGERRGQLPHRRSGR